MLHLRNVPIALIFEALFDNSEVVEICNILYYAQKES